MNTFNANKFAEWLKSAFANSNIKSQMELVRLANSNKATISRLMNASPQTVSAKASKPKPELCIKLAEIFGVDKDFVLQLGGHAPTKPNLIIRGFDDTLDESDVKKIEEFIAFLKSQKST